MSNKIKIGLIGLMFIGAVFCGAFAVTELVKAEYEPEPVPYNAENMVQSYILREHQGYVAVFIENNPSGPITVTNIQVSTLPELDRRLLRTGMTIRSHERLIMTLEDLSS